MQYKTLFSFSLLFLLSQLLIAQTKLEKDTTNASSKDSLAIPVIEYSNSAPKYEIAGIKVTGADNYEDFVPVSYTHLTLPTNREV